MKIIRLRGINYIRSDNIKNAQTWVLTKVSDPRAQVLSNEL